MKLYRTIPAVTMLCYSVVGFLPVKGLLVAPLVSEQAQAAPASQPATSPAGEDEITGPAIHLRLTTAAERLECVAVADLLLRVVAVVAAWLLAKPAPQQPGFR